MRCDICGTELKSEDHECSTCKYAESKIQVLTPEERRRFKGATIDQGAFTEQQYHDDANSWYGSKQRIYVKHFNLANAGIITKLLIIVALIFTVFVAIPFVMLLIGIGVLIWLIVRR